VTELKWRPKEELHKGFRISTGRKCSRGRLDVRGATCNI